MSLWNHWLEAALQLRPACSRARAFVWLLLALAGLCARADNSGVTSLVRVWGVTEQAYINSIHQQGHINRVRSHQQHQQGPTGINRHQQGQVSILLV